jgi:hypothetical protein
LRYHSSLEYSAICHLPDRKLIRLALTTRINTLGKEKDKVKEKKERRNKKKKREKRKRKRKRKEKKEKEKRKE